MDEPTKKDTHEMERELARLKSVVHGAITPMMRVDRDLVIIDANPAAIKLFTDAEHEMAKVYPGFSVDNMVGTCIDTFHKRPEHQRSILADPNRMPFHSELTVGPITLEFTVAANYDQHGEHIGNSVELIRCHGKT